MIPELHVIIAESEKRFSDHVHDYAGTIQAGLDKGNDVRIRFECVISQEGTTTYKSSVGLSKLEDIWPQV